MGRMIREVRDNAILANADMATLKKTVVRIEIRGARIACIPLSEWDKDIDIFELHRQHYEKIHGSGSGKTMLKIELQKIETAIEYVQQKQARFEREIEISKLAISGCDNELAELLGNKKKIEERIKQTLMGEG
ncbi:hypothetical protein FACS1894103_4700 [Campylobacterota bacterium]|nr:hypothetical protein FACS1894103_4700 [Campylobacterota bacterium]